MVGKTELEDLRVPSSTHNIKGPTMWHEFQHHRFVYVGGLFIPLVLYAAFVGFPVVYTLYLSCVQWNGLDPEMRFVGLRNYVDLTHDPYFILSLVNNIKWAVLSLLFPVVLGLLFAVLLQSGRMYLNGMFRSIIFLPTTMSLVTVGLMFALILNPEFGALNGVLTAIGLGALAHDWLGDPNTALYTLIAVFSWAYMGIPLMLFYAGIGQIPVDLYEASRIEGASALQTLRYITLPSLRPVATVVIMLAVINSLRSFDLVMVMTRGGPANQTAVLGYLMYTETFVKNFFGYGAAISTVILLLSSVFAALYLWRVAGESLYAS